MNSVDYKIDDTKEMLKLALQKLNEIETCVRPLKEPAGVWISCKSQKKPHSGKQSMFIIKADIPRQDT